MQILIHTVRMARILHIEQKIENFRAFESAIERYQNAESAQFYKRDRSVEKAQVRVSYKLNERLNIQVYSWRQELQVSRDRSERIYLSIYLSIFCAVGALCMFSYF